MSVLSFLWYREVSVFRSPGLHRVTTDWSISNSPKDGPHPVASLDHSSLTRSLTGESGYIRRTTLLTLPSVRQVILSTPRPF